MGRQAMDKRFLTAIVAVLALFAAAWAADDQDEAGEYFAGQDLHVQGQTLSIYKGPELKDTHVLVFENGFSMTIGDHQLSSDQAVVFLRTLATEFRKVMHIDHEARVYLEGNVSIAAGKAARTTDLSQVVVDRGEALVAGFQVTGQVFATAEDHRMGTPADLPNVPLYQNALAVMAPVKTSPAIPRGAQVPDVVDVVRDFSPELAREKAAAGPDGPAAVEDQPRLEYPVNIAGLWQPAPTIEKTTTPEGLNIATVIGRFYLWQKRDDQGSLLEFMADSAVIYYEGNDVAPAEGAVAETSMPAGSVKSVYFKGNIVMTEGPRTLRADELFYDFQTRKALAVNAEMRNFDPARGIPIYIRAAKLRAVSEDVFQAQDVTLTSSEFYLPQVSAHASEMVLTDTTSIDARTGKKLDEGSYDATLRGVAVNYYDTTLFKWPKVRTDFERPDVPIRRMSIGHDSDYGTLIETQWYLARLLGREEPAGVDSTLALDYYSKRGPAVGAAVEYTRDDYFGEMLGYIIQDHGEDDLGRISDRRNLEPPNDTRGRYTWRHRQYLPYDWQLTGEVSYLSDENFLESFYRSEFNNGKAQETLLHLKRLKDNWAFSFLAKPRINDFETVTEELPTLEYHLKGASFWDHKLTFYSDTQVGRWRDRVGSGSTSTTSQDFYTFAFSRNEVDLPLLLNAVKIVPFVAGTYSFEDLTGYDTTLDGDVLAEGDDSVALGEVGIRTSTMFWKENQFVKSTFWDLNGMRHILKPHFEATLYEATDDTFDQRNIYNLGLSQRWQSRRGTPRNLRSFDWMRLDVDATWVKDGADSAQGPPPGENPTAEVPTYGPAAYIWNNPEIPFGVRRTSNFFGLVRDSINADYAWRVSDTTSILSDLNYDIRSGVVQQFDMGVSRFIYPDVSLYLGNRYLRPVLITDPDDTSDILQKGSNSVVAALTYTLTPRYTIVLSEEYNFDYGANVRTEVTILRRYHRLYYGLTFAADESLDRQAVIFSLFPQGVDELAFGRRKYAGLEGLTVDD